MAEFRGFEYRLMHSTAVGMGILHYREDYRLTHLVTAMSNASVTQHHKYLLRK